MNETLSRERERVRILGEGKPSPKARTEMEQALQSKHHGVRVIAAQALGRWGGRRSAEALKAAYERDLGNREHFALRKQYLAALAKCYDRKDVPWILDMYFSEEISHPDTHYLRRELISTMPHGWIRERVMAELQSANAQNRKEAAQALALMKAPVPEAKK